MGAAPTNWQRTIRQEEHKTCNINKPGFNPHLDPKYIYKKDKCLVMHPTVAKRLRNYVKNNKHFLVAAYLRKYLR